jgi:phage terminase large subunit-like protein
MNVRDLPQDQLEALHEEVRGEVDKERLHHYQPNKKQKVFHEAGARHKERGFMAGNQLGKTLGGGAEVAMHLTGMYPDWWNGKRFDHANTWWVGSETAEATRDNAQRILFGRWNRLGTGMIPADCIKGINRRSGTPEAIAIAEVMHVTGKTSVVIFKSYDQGRLRWAGDTVDGGIWFDEEPPMDIYTEGNARLNATQGVSIATFTPLLGMSEVVRLFYPLATTPARHLTMMAIDDVTHYTADERAAIIAKYPKHERDARSRGIPLLGSGRIFPVSEESISVPAIKIPRHWPRLGGMDFGYDHPFAAIKLAYNRDADCVYITHAYREREATPVIHAAAIKPWGPHLQWAWPHDGLQHDKGSGKALASLYRKQGLNLLPEHATFEDGGNGVEAGIADMLERMQTGRLKVFSHLEDWFAEFRTYHRKDGKVVKENDDLLSATRYSAAMSLRFADLETEPLYDDFDDPSDSWRTT